MRRQVGYISQKYALSMTYRGENLAFYAGCTA